MPRFKTPDYGLKMIPVDFQRQVLPGSFEFALCHLVDKELDLSALRSRVRNDAGGAPAFDPAVLLKIVLLAHSRGLVSSRSIEAACRHNVLFMAVSGDTCPHFTTLAAFVSELGDEVARLFAQVLVVCDRQKLIGRELFAIDGVKLPSNASKEKSGTRADFERHEWVSGDRPWFPYLGVKIRGVRVSDNRLLTNFTPRGREKERE